MDYLCKIEKPSFGLKDLSPVISSIGRCPHKSDTNLPILRLLLFKAQGRKDF